MGKGFNWLFNFWKIYYIWNLNILFKRLLKSTLFCLSLIKFNAVVVEILVFETCYVDMFFGYTICFSTFYFNIKHFYASRFNVSFKAYIKIISYWALYVKAIIIFKATSKKEFSKMLIKFNKSNSFSFQLG